MSNTVVPTKGNLLAAKKSLALSRVGYRLLNQKRNILIHELMTLTERARKIQAIIGTAYAEAYQALQTANITLGLCKEIAYAVPIEPSLSLTFRSVMGVELPVIRLKKHSIIMPYGFTNTNTALDVAYQQFRKVKEYTAELAEVENCIYRLADAIKQTQKRANALHNVMIPRFSSAVKLITESLEEKEREEFSRMKIIKTTKAKQEHEAENT